MALAVETAVQMTAQKQMRTAGWEGHCCVSGIKDRDATTLSLSTTLSGVCREPSPVFCRSVAGSLAQKDSAVRWTLSEVDSQ